jgi:5'-3' exonuclease
MQAPRVYLIDSSIYIFRAWHSFDAGLLDRDGRPANAVFGFSDFLFQLLRQTRAAHIACAFDASQTDSYRKGLYPSYKANREPAPDELRYQFARCRDFCRAVGIAEFGSERFEADDIIGSLARRYRDRGYAVTVVSADKDLAQLVRGEHDQWWDFARGVLLDQHGVRKHFGVWPHQIADMLALSGDKVDNIPGIPGVGYATAARLLHKFENLDGILANVSGIAAMKFRGAARIQSLVRDHLHLFPLNRQLTTVVTDMSDFAQAPDLSWRGVDQDALDALAEQLACGPSFRQRWLGLHAVTGPTA